jgi:hypothetical protein
MNIFSQRGCLRVDASAASRGIPPGASSRRSFRYQPQPRHPQHVYARLLFDASPSIDHPAIQGSTEYGVRSRSTESLSGAGGLDTGWRSQSDEAALRRSELRGCINTANTDSITGCAVRDTTAAHIRVRPER